MNTVITVIRYELWILLFALAAIVAYQLLTGTIITRGLMRDKTGGRNFSPGRLQLLIATVGGALYLLKLIYTNTTVGEFPEIPTELLLMLGGSHAFYLGGKLAGALRQIFGLSPSKKDASP